ncbi:FAD/NAD(P)-binding protein [Glarea lozoyensis ATCC 20868]|uniref:FAD/NAD(P)-binding protein n=1 Tax=Glarea lozoyensis (strain ATCC 20868 / MF5171) TaxID=1116229 RepID=S3D5E0_GLAL2|nr:FAD/NAD(P)-binding protein [Glarea lozoyensis ATCC 20868]EPE32304.1 FAD/NAD(P)-binding protein [Glarea lozoyensis ATCC 20868]
MTMWPFRTKYPEHKPEEVNGKEYDFVVVGGGTAGCVLASRLSEDPKVSVLLIERGPLNDSWMSRIPLLSTDIFNPSTGAVSWDCEPLKYCDDRVTQLYCGEVMGGTSRINGMVYTRGNPAEYEAWAALGYPNWSYEKVLPYFIKSEKHVHQYWQKWRGISGPWINKSIVYAEWVFNAFRAFLDAATANGFPLVLDGSSPKAPNEGVVVVDSTINKRSERVSTLQAFLPHDVVSKRSNLTICTKAVVSRLTFVMEDGRPRPDEVLLRHSDSKSEVVYSVKVKKEVIVCSGTFGSPPLLMRSGIGPRKHLEEHKIVVVRDLEGVGFNLKDHHGFPLVWETPLNESLSEAMVHPFKKALPEMVKYILHGTGIFSMPSQHIALFARSRAISDDGSEYKFAGDNTNAEPSDNLPDLELIPAAISTIDKPGEQGRSDQRLGTVSILATYLVPESSGSIRLSSTNLFDRPKVDFGFLSNPADYIVLRKAIRLSLKLAEIMKASGFPLLNNITYPEASQQKDAENGNDDELDRLIRQYIRSVFHWSCTCKMGSEDDLGVVDEELKVHGVTGLRICDASIFPKGLSAHLQAPVVMVAERCADFIKSGM